MLRIALRGLFMLAALGLPTLALLACVQRPALVVETSNGDIIRLHSWTATLSSPSGALRGTATLSPGSTYRETLATVSLSGAAPHTVHGWYVQLGTCGHDLGILSPQAYTAIVADSAGAARSVVTLPFTVPTSGHYFVSVRGSPSEGSATAACGNLTKDHPARGPTIAEARAP